MQGVGTPSMLTHADPCQPMLTQAKAYMVEAPFMFNGLWKLVTPILKKSTQEKVQFAYVILCEYIFIDSV